MENDQLKTMLECLDIVSQNNGYGYVNWAHACRESLDVQLNYIPQEAGKMYANQFKSSPASTVKVVSDNDVFMQAVKLYPLGPGGNPEDRETWIKGFKACREQLTGKS